MSTTTGSPLRQPRVPAWKRLGLKLKYAKEDAESHSFQATGSSVNLQTSTGDGPQGQLSNDNVRPEKEWNTTPEPLHDSRESVTNGIFTDSRTLERQQGPVDERTSESRAELLVDREDHEPRSVNE